MSKHILIRATVIPSGLAALTDHQDALVYMHVPASSEAAANTLLATIDDEDFIASGSVQLEEGNISNIIVLPKEAGKK